jgi:hypothetical protein
MRRAKRTFRRKSHVIISCGLVYMLLLVLHMPQDKSLTQRVPGRNVKLVMMEKYSKVKFRLQRYALQYAYSVAVGLVNIPHYKLKVVSHDSQFLRNVSAQPRFCK